MQKVSAQGPTQKAQKGETGFYIIIIIMLLLVCLSYCNYGQYLAHSRRSINSY